MTIAFAALFLSFIGTVASAQKIAEEELVGTVASHDVRLKKLEADVAEIRARCDAAVKKADACAAGAPSATDTSCSKLYVQDYVARQCDMTGVEKELAELRRDGASSRGRISRLENLLDKLQRERAAGDAALAKRIDVIDATLKVIQKEFPEIKGLVTDLRRDTDKLRQDLDMAISQIQDTLKILHEFGVRLDAAETKMKELDARVSMVEKRMDSLEKAVAAKQDRIRLDLSPVVLVTKADGAAFGATLGVDIPLDSGTWAVQLGSGFAGASGLFSLSPRMFISCGSAVRFLFGPSVTLGFNSDGSISKTPALDIGLSYVSGHFGIYAAGGPGYQLVTDSNSLAYEAEGGIIVRF